MRVHIGSRRITTADSITPVAGKAVAATSAMTIAGIKANSGTSTTIHTPTITTTVAVEARHAGPLSA